MIARLYIRANRKQEHLRVKQSFPKGLKSKKRVRKATLSAAAKMENIRQSQSQMTWKDKRRSTRRNHHEVSRYHAEHNRHCTRYKTNHDFWEIPKSEKESIWVGIFISPWLSCSFNEKKHFRGAPKRNYKIPGGLDKSLINKRMISFRESYHIQLDACKPPKQIHEFKKT